MKNNKIGIILIVIALIVVGYFMFFKEKATAANIPAEATNNNNLGVTASGKPITEEMIQKEINIIKATPSWFSNIQKSAAEAKIEVNEALRNAAIWMLKNNH